MCLCAFFVLTPAQCTTLYTCRQSYSHSPEGGVFCSPVCYYLYLMSLSRALLMSDTHNM